MNLVSRGVYLKKYEKMSNKGAYSGFHVKIPIKIDTQKFSHLFINPETLLKIKILFVL